jgi:hypothetical protein
VHGIVIAARSVLGGKKCISFSREADVSGSKILFLHSWSSPSAVNKRGIVSRANAKRVYTVVFVLLGFCGWVEVEDRG